MSGVIAHRGPDGDGLIHPSPRICLAHRRLSIIDLSAGQQPMATENGIAITFNGEIYNYIELRDELRRNGAVFHTDSDTEVILRLYEAYGPSMVQRLRGMYAFAIWDPRSEQLLLARDRIGKKPLYYALVDGCVYFASTFGAVCLAVGGKAQLDPRMAGTFLNLGYVPAPHSIDARIQKLPAGCMATARGGNLSVQPFWEADADVEPFEGTWNQAVDRLDDLIRTAVSIRLRSDVPLGVFLSGGIDSSLVAAMAARIAPGSINTFSIGFDVRQFDESAYAAEVARRIGSQHRTFRVHYDGLGLLPELVRHYGEPFGDSSAIPTWLLSRETRKHVTVAVGGDGGDEAFGGYNWYRTATRFLKLATPGVPMLASAGTRALSLPAAYLPSVRKIYRGMRLLALDEPDRYAALRSFIAQEDVDRLYAGRLTQSASAASDEGRRIMTSLYAETSGSSLRRMRVVDLKTYMADCLLPKVDVASMAHALEVRAPLLDQEVVQFALTLPDQWVSTKSTGKVLLRAVLDRYLPAHLFERPKQGFSVPLDTWFKRELRSTVGRLPTSEPLIDSGWFRSEGIQSMIDEHNNGGRDHTHRLYNLLILDEWLRQN
jgi:asparagine synthase (glutamine-hydrolysing)